MADNNPTTGVQGYADSETKLKADGTPDQRFKEVSIQTIASMLRLVLIAARRWTAR